MSPDAVAVEALAGTSAMAPAVPNATAAEVKAMSGLWFNPEEPGLFELAWKNAEPTVTMNGMPFALARRSDGWLAAEAGALVIAGYLQTMDAWRPWAWATAK